MVIIFKNWNYFCNFELVGKNFGVLKDKLIMNVNGSEITSITRSNSFVDMPSIPADNLRLRFPQTLNTSSIFVSFKTNVCTMHIITHIIVTVTGSDNITYCIRPKINIKVIKFIDFVIFWSIILITFKRTNMLPSFFFNKHVDQKLAIFCKTCRQLAHAMYGLALLQNIRS